MALRPESTQYATTEEAHDAILSFKKSDFTKLMMIASSFTRRRFTEPVVEPDDLLQEALFKTLAGRRRWNRTVSIIKHLDRVMESDSGHVAEQRVQNAQGARELEQHPDVHPETAPRRPSPEDLLQDRETLNGALAYFAEDKKALQLIFLKGDDYSASEIQRGLGMSKTEYDTVTKRIRRRVANIEQNEENDNAA